MRYSVVKPLNAFQVTDELTDTPLVVGKWKTEKLVLKIKTFFRIILQYKL